MVTGCSGPSRRVSGAWRLISDRPVWRSCAPSQSALNRSAAFKIDAVRRLAFPSHKKRFRVAEIIRRWLFGRCDDATRGEPNELCRAPHDATGQVGLGNRDKLHFRRTRGSSTELVSRPTAVVPPTNPSISPFFPSAKFGRRRGASRRITKARPGNETDYGFNQHLRAFQRL
jgi:hypothetical protein